MKRHRFARTARSNGDCAPACLFSCPLLCRLLCRPPPATLRRSQRSCPSLTLQPLPGCEKLLLKQAQLALKAARPAEPLASAAQDEPQDYSKAIALMRKEYFADVDEYERSGLLKIPPLPDPRGAGILPASLADPNPACASPPGAPASPAAVASARSHFTEL